MNSWNGSDLGVQQTEFDTAARLVTAALDAGPHSTSKIVSPLRTAGSRKIGTLRLCLPRGHRAQIHEVSDGGYLQNLHYLLGNLGEKPQPKLDGGKNPEFHSLLQRFKAASQYLDIHINVDQVDGIRKWTATVCKEIVETARRSATAEIEAALHTWKIDQLTIKQLRLEEDLKRTTLECNVNFFQVTVEAPGLTIGDPTAAPPSQPTPSTGDKHMMSGSTPLPARTAKPALLPSVPDASPT
jgi:hypothetical protein